MTAPAPLPRDHIRRPDLPWRQSRITECGRPIDDVNGWVDRPAAVARIHREGVQRAALFLCMTCLNTARNHPEWDENPVKALAREFYGATDPGLHDELLALGALVAAHREEFDGYLKGLTETVSLAAARRARRGRSA
jgi:hypothetical protein